MSCSPDVRLGGFVANPPDLPSPDHGKKKRGDSSATWARVKYDRQIVAVAKVAGATTIYSDDGDVAALAKAAKVEVVRLADLPLPPEDAQLKLELTVTAGDEIGDQDTTTETAS
jgi:hypothetical protein